MGVWTEIRSSAMHFVKKMKVSCRFSAWAAMVLFRRFFAMLNYVENLFLSKNEGIGDHFCPKQRVLNKRKNVCTSCAKKECVVKHRLWRTSVSRICRTVPESLWRKLINSTDLSVVFTIVYVLQGIVAWPICTRNTWRTVPVSIWWPKKAGVKEDIVLAFEFWTSKEVKKVVWHNMVSYKMRMHTCPLDGHRKSVERCSLFRMSPRDMAIACLSWWEPQKSSWQILTFSKYRPATSWPSCCMMVACITVAEKS